MDQQPNIPDIKPDVNREERGRSGVLAGLLHRLGLGSGGSAGGLGGGAGAGLSGGLLATKAGIIGLVLVGTTLAGSIGVVGYKLFGPSSADRADADVSSLFAVKPKTAAGAASRQDGAASADGVSRSLDYLVNANAKPQGQAAADQTADAAAAAAASAAPPLKNDNAPGQGAAARLKTDKKFGELAKSLGSGSGASSGASASAGAGGAGALLASAKGGSLGAQSGAARAAAGDLKGVRSGRRLGAMKQLGQVYRDNKGATTSQAAGRTYDGNAQTASQIGPEAGTPSAETGAGTTAASQNPPVTPGSGSGERFPAVPPVSGTNVTPWQAAINTAILLLTAAAALLFIATKAAKASWGGQTMALILAGLAGALSLAVIAFGAMIGGGKFGQPLQGGLLTLAGGLMAVTAATVMIDLWGATGDKLANFSVHWWTMLAGGAALAAAAWAYMAPAKKYDSGLFKDGRAPDWDHGYEAAQVVQPPTQRILDQYLV